MQIKEIKMVGLVMTEREAIVFKNAIRDVHDNLASNKVDDSTTSFIERLNQELEDTCAIPTDESEIEDD